MPGILFGAAYGRLVGVFVADIHPRQTVHEVGVKPVKLGQLSQLGQRPLLFGVGLTTGLTTGCRHSLLAVLKFAGKAVGRVAGQTQKSKNPQTTNPKPCRRQGTYALLGAASFLGGSMRLTVCTCVMLLELTNNLSLLPLVMLVLLVAKVGGNGLVRFGLVWCLGRKRFHGGAADEVGGRGAALPRLFMLAVRSRQRCYSRQRWVEGSGPRR